MKNPPPSVRPPEVRNGPIDIDWQRDVRSDYPPAEVELVSSSLPATRDPPTATQTDEDDDSGGSEGYAERFKKLSDHQLQEQIKRCRSSTANLGDGGLKLRKFIRRLEKELDRRRAAGPRKGYTAHREVAQSTSGDDPYTLNDCDKLNLESISGKCHLKPCFAARIKSAGKAEGEAFFKEINCFNPGKHVDLRKAGQRASNPANYQLINYECQNITSRKRLNMYFNITAKRRKTSCITSRQENNFASSNHMSKKLHVEDENLGSSIVRWDCSKNQTYESQGLSIFNKIKEKKEVICLDDEDTKPAKLVAEMANKWDALQIYYPSRTDLDTVELTYDDIKCVEPRQLLKSPVINFYIQNNVMALIRIMLHEILTFTGYLKKSRPRDDLYIFNTYFHSKLEKALSKMDECDSEFNRLRRWWKSVDIFKTSYIILPIHGQMHWSLIIICMPAKETKAGPIMLHLDSLGLHSSDGVFNLIGSYLIAEWRHLQNDSSYDIPFSESIWRLLSRNIDKQNVEVPRQQNDYDCGIFMLYYIDKFIQEAPERLTREGLCMFGRKWFYPEEASGLRERIRALLFDVFQGAPPNDGDSQSESHLDNQSEGEDKDGDASIVTIIS